MCVINATGEYLDKHSRNFGPASDQIHELSSLLTLATALHVNLHVSWGNWYPHEWELDLIENTGCEPGSGSHVLKLLTDAADLHRKEIVGLAQNMSNSRLPPDEWLLVWYEKHGFIRASTEVHGVRIRRPRSSQMRERREI
jgi:hypothetical protein